MSTATTRRLAKLEQAAAGIIVTGVPRAPGDLRA